MHEYHFHIAVHSIVFFVVVVVRVRVSDRTSLASFLCVARFHSVVPLLVGRERLFSLYLSLCVCDCVCAYIHFGVHVILAAVTMFATFTISRHQEREVYSLDTNKHSARHLWNNKFHSTEKTHTHSVRAQRDLKPNRNNTEWQTEMALCARRDGRR